MTYRVLLRREADGVERWSDFDLPHDNALFWWGRFQGNYGCDCNRGMTFAYAGGEYDEDIDDEEDNRLYPCGHDHYTLVRLELPDGQWFSDAEPHWHPTSDQPPTEPAAR